MKISKGFIDFVNKHADRRKLDTKTVFSTYVSLFLAVVVLISATLSWFIADNKAKIDSAEFTMRSATGLRVNDGASISNHITLDNIYLAEASSVDGRNIFFPATGTYSSNTNEMLFREGTAGDRNHNYVYKDFTLMGDSDFTNIYIKGYDITVGEEGKDGYEKFNGSTEIVYNGNTPTDVVKHKECPIRIAFISDSAVYPKVIDPTALFDNYAKTYHAVSFADSYGYPGIAESPATAFSSYYFATNNPLFILHGSQEIDVTMVVWLEGTSEACKNYIGKPISIDLELESNYSDTEMITFIDDTIGDDESAKPWIDGEDILITMTYKDVTAKDPAGNPITRTVVMQKSPEKINGKNAWFAPIPNEVVTDITFARYDVKDEIIYNAWYTKKDVNNGISKTVITWTSGHPLEESREITKDGETTRHTVYTAKRGNGNSVTEDTAARLSPCVGYWDTSGSGSSGGGGGGSGSGGTTGGYVKLSIAVNITKTWVQDNLLEGYDLYAMVGGKEVKINKNTNCDRCELKDYAVTAGTKVTSIFLKITRSDGTIHIKNDLRFDGVTVPEGGGNLTFSIDNSDKVA